MTDELLKIARLQLGLKETTGKNDGPEIQKFTGGRQEPWCAHFVAWCFREIGKPLPTDQVPSPTQHNPLASVLHMKKVFDKNKWVTDIPQPGDIVFFSTRGKSDAGVGRHVGIVEKIEKDHFISIEGNLGNAVKRVKHKYTEKNIWSYGRLK
jgi:cell wall-associated NlpC family hydrolase